MALFIDLTGRRFGRLTVAARAPKRTRKTLWSCICDCGKECIVRADHLSRSHTQSCGCVGAKRLEEGRTTHGLYKSRTYSIWQAMIARCCLEKHRGFASYGGAGIAVDPRWRASFSTFLSDMGGEAPSDCSIDRIDGTKGYFPGNCRWATAAVQARNKRSNINIGFDGRTQILADWAKELGINSATLHARVMVYKWPIHRAFTEPVHRANPAK